MIRNFLDRAIAAIAPAHAVKREQARMSLAALGGYYEGQGRDARRSMFRFRPGDGSADSALLPNLKDLRQDSRGLVRVAPIARAAIHRLATNVVGPGLTYEPEIDRDVLGLSEDQADEWKAIAKREFTLFSESRNCDATRQQNLAGLQNLTYRSVLESGDVFVAKRSIERVDHPYSLAFQLFEADQIDNPPGVIDGQVKDGRRIVKGVELDGDGAAVAYHFLKNHPGELGQRGNRDTERVPVIGAATGRMMVKHFYRVDRVGLHRGEPILAPVIEMLRQLATYTNAELMAAVIGAMITVVYETKDGSTLKNVNPDEETGDESETDTAYDMVPGKVMELYNQQKIDVPTPGRPNTAFDVFFVAVVRQIGAALGLPFEVLIQHFTASYSASRAALEQAWLLFRRDRKWLADEFCQWSYREFLWEAVSLNRIAAPGFDSDPILRQAWSGAIWIGPARISLDPLRENKADEIAEAHAWKTGAQNTRERTGGSFERNVEIIGREKKLKQESGVLAEPVAAPQEPDPPPEDPPVDRPEDERKEEN
jgi:lambda family phage portal protein